MKKIILMSSLFIFVFLIILIITKEAPVDFEITYVDALETSKNKLKVCVLKDNGKLVLIDVEKKNNEYDYLYLLKLYDHYRNSLPLNYNSPLKGNFEIKKLEKKEDHLEIELQVLYLVDNFNLFLTALMWSYQELGINTISVKANQEVFNLRRNTSINPQLEAINLDNAREQLIIFLEEEVLLPITYFHDQDQMSFLINKLFAHFPDLQVSYDSYGDMIIMNIYDPFYQLSTEVFEVLGTNLENLGYFDIIIIKNDLLVYHN